MFFQKNKNNDSIRLEKLKEHLEVEIDDEFEIDSMYILQEDPNIEICYKINYKNIFFNLIYYNYECYMGRHKYLYEKSFIQYCNDKSDIKDFIGCEKLYPVESDYNDYDCTGFQTLDDKMMLQEDYTIECAREFVEKNEVVFEYIDLTEVENEFLKSVYKKDCLKDNDYIVLKYLFLKSKFCDIYDDFKFKERIEYLNASEKLELENPNIKKYDISKIQEISEKYDINLDIKILDDDLYIYIENNWCYTLEDDEKVIKFVNFIKEIGDFLTN